MESRQVRRYPAAAHALASEAISAFTSRYQEHWLAGMREKLGLSGNEDGDLDLVSDLLHAMHENDADFTLTFRRLCAAAADETADAEVRGLFANPGAYDSWAADGDRVWPLTSENPTHAPRRCEPSIQLSSRAIIAWSNRSTQRSITQTFRRSSSC